MGEGVIEVVHDLVVHRAAELRMRVQDDCDRGVFLRRRVIAAFDAAGRSSEDDFRHERYSPRQVGPGGDVSGNRELACGGIFNKEISAGRGKISCASPKRFKGTSARMFFSTWPVEMPDLVAIVSIKDDNRFVLVKPGKILLTVI